MRGELPKAKNGAHRESLDQNNVKLFKYIKFLLKIYLKVLKKK